MSGTFERGIAYATDLKADKALNPRVVPILPCYRNEEEYNKINRGSIERLPWEDYSQQSAGALTVLEDGDVTFVDIAQCEESEKKKLLEDNIFLIPPTDDPKVQFSRDFTTVVIAFR